MAGEREEGDGFRQEFGVLGALPGVGFRVRCALRTGLYVLARVKRSLLSLALYYLGRRGMFDGLGDRRCDWPIQIGRK